MKITTGYVRKKDFRDFWLAYNDIKSYSKDDKDYLKVFVPDLMEGSDYGGDSVTKSNYRTFLALAKENKWYGVRKIKGGYYSYGIALTSPAMDNPAIKQLLADLENYPLIDEEDLSSLELELEEEAWENCGRDDWARCLADALAEEEVKETSTLSDGALWKLYRQACEASNCYTAIEEGCTVYFPFDDILSKAKAILDSCLPPMTKERKEKLAGQLFFQE